MKTKHRLSEEAILRDELADSRRAMSENATAVKVALINAVNPASWARIHPWLTAAAAGVAGFAVAKKLFDADAPNGVVAERTPQHYRSDGRSWKRSAFNGLKTALTESLALYSQMKLAGLAARESATAPPDETDSRQAHYADDMEDAAAYSDDRSAH